MSVGTAVPITWGGRRTTAFVPSLLADRSLDLADRTIARTARAQVEVEHGAASMPDDFAPLARLLLRAEGVASSYVEGVTAPVVDIVLAESSPQPDPTSAGWVAANLRATLRAVDDAHRGPLSIDDLLRWHRHLMAGGPTPARHVGVLRDEQGWIGGTSPFDAHLVTPPPGRVPALMDDLLDYANRDDVDPIAQIAVAHAQFEIIHPFADGNGRIGRVLVAWLLARRLSLITPPPVSIRIAADVGGYAAGLALFRLGDHDSWICWFADAVSGAGRSQRDLVAEVERLQGEWRSRLSGRVGERAIRSDATAWRVLELLPRHLVLTASTVTGELGVPPKTAGLALRDLALAGVVVEHGTVPTAGRPGRLYVSPELLGLAGSNPLRA